FITLPGTSNGAAAVRGIVFYYPDQGLTSPPTAYPWTIFVSNGANCAIENIEFVNSYQAIKSDGGGRLLVRNIIGQAIAAGLYVGHNYDVSRFENIHWIAIWQLPSSAIGTWQQSNGYGFKFGRV